MNYCERCILPDTRPGLKIGRDGVCSACLSHGQDARLDRLGGTARQFATLVDEVRTLGRPYDCVIPVSGGKDSTWQVVTCLKWGMRPLAVTWRTPGRGLSSASATCATSSSSESTTWTSRSRRTSSGASWCGPSSATARRRCRCTWRSSMSPRPSRFATTCPSSCGARTPRSSTSGAIRGDVLRPHRRVGSQVRRRPGDDRR